MNGSDIGRRRQAAKRDPLTTDQRRRNMSRIRARDTKPEMLLRRALHHAGLRYRLHDRNLPGTPDIVMRPRGAVIFVHGCFWHAHNCPLGVIPATRREFWTAKLERNRQRDQGDVHCLLAAGWRVATVWECALTGKARHDPAQVVAALTSWLSGDSDRLEIIGSWE
ncbi:very short patch repair endonuclease [Azospirillum endophyticum]